MSPGTKRPAGGGKNKGGSRSKKAKRKEIKEEEEEKPVLSGGQRPKNSKRRSVASKVSYKEESNSEEDEEEEISDAEGFQETSEDDSDDFETSPISTKKRTGNRKSSAKTSKSQNTAAPKGRSGGGKQSETNEEREWEDEDVTIGTTKRRSWQKKEGPGADEWLEVFLDKSSSWVCVDVEHGVGVPQLCSQNATAPLTYVVAVDGDGFLKELGRKYDPTWMTTSRKRRVDDEWWEETLEPFMGPEDERDKNEEKEVWSYIPLQMQVLWMFISFERILISE